MHANSNGESYANRCVPQDLLKNDPLGQLFNPIDVVVSTPINPEALVLDVGAQTYTV